jgi:glucose-6-phosphate-specific signal transduction histidine kinase
MMIIAPGNSVRSAQVASNEYGLLWQIFLRMYSVCKGAWDYLFPVILVTAALVLVNVCVLGNRLRKSEILLLIGAVLSWGAMILSPHYPDRAAFGTMCLLLCVAVSQAAAILKSRNSKACTLTMAGIGIFIWLRGMYFLGEFLSISWGWIR